MPKTSPDGSSIVNGLGKTLFFLVDMATITVTLAILWHVIRSPYLLCISKIQCDWSSGVMRLLYLKSGDFERSCWATNRATSLKPPLRKSS